MLRKFGARICWICAAYTFNVNIIILQCVFSLLRTFYGSVKRTYTMNGWCTIMNTKTREHFGSRMGFLLVAAGCAIGLGNVWRFPYIAGPVSYTHLTLPTNREV